MQKFFRIGVYFKIELLKSAHHQTNYVPTNLINAAIYKLNLAGITGEPSLKKVISSFAPPTSSCNAFLYNSFCFSFWKSLKRKLKYFNVTFVFKVYIAKQY